MAGTDPQDFQRPPLYAVTFSVDAAPLEGGFLMELHSLVQVPL
jgi:hypothetical protein